MSKTKTLIGLPCEHCLHNNICYRAPIVEALDEKMKGAAVKLDTTGLSFEIKCSDFLPYSTPSKEASDILLCEAVDSKGYKDEFYKKREVAVDIWNQIKKTLND